MGLKVFRRKVLSLENLNKNEIVRAVSKETKTANPSQIWWIRDAFALSICTF